MTKLAVWLIPTVAWAALATPALVAQPATTSGDFQIGFRSVDVGGSQNKFREDINLDDGPRLFRLGVEYNAAESGKLSQGFIDRMRLDIHNFGGDPFETLGLSIEKTGSFKFRYDRRKSAYFYEDLLAPQATLDFHTFDFDRVNDRASFDVKVSERAKIGFGLNRFTRKGESTTTLDIQRDEFELDAPIDESLNDYNGFFQYDWKRTTVIVEERYRDFENVAELFLPGQSLGEDPDDPAVLDFFFAEQPYDFTSLDHTVRVIARPTDDLSLQVLTNVQQLDLDLSLDERSQGTTFTGDEISGETTARGEISRDLAFFDLDLAYRINPRWGLIFGYRQSDLNQDGTNVIDAELNTGQWDIEMQSAEFGGQAHVSSNVTVAAGVRISNREINAISRTAEDELTSQEDTDQLGFFASAAWQPTKRSSVNLELEDSSYDRPFTLSAPTDRLRAKLKGRFMLTNGWSVSGTVTRTDVENTDSGWDSTFDQLTLRVAYSRDRFHGSFGYSAFEVDRSINQVVTTLPGFGGGVVFDFPIAYLVETDFLQAKLRYEGSERWSVGGHARLYDTSGSVDLARDDFGGWVEFGLGATGYVAHLGYRTIDYSESGFAPDNYTADIAEVSVGYRW